MGYWCKHPVSIIALLFIICPPLSIAKTIKVPRDIRKIQKAIDVAQDGDVVLISPGIYYENLKWAGKSLRLASKFYTTGKQKYIEQTVIDGGGGTVIQVDPDADDSAITGLRIQNGSDGILVFPSIHLSNNHIISNVDGVDYEGGGGRCINNLIAYNLDDGIDLDGPSAVSITNNTIRDNLDDGIEIRFHEYTGAVLNIEIRENLISRNDEDGIQLIDYPGLSERVFRIEHNLLIKNKMVGIGLMDNGETIEDFRGAAILERVHLTNNTFVGNSHAVTGGANLIALNNIFVDSKNIAIKNLKGDSIASYNLFWNNSTDYLDSTIDLTNTIFEDPLLKTNYCLAEGSPAIDQGTALFNWNGETVLDMPSTSYSGKAPDMGAQEYDEDSGGGCLPIGYDEPPGIQPVVQSSSSGCFVSTAVNASKPKPHARLFLVLAKMIDDHLVSRWFSTVYWK